jgi:hypothetical protein
MSPTRIALAIRSALLARLQCRRGRRPHPAPRRRCRTSATAQSPARGCHSRHDCFHRSGPDSRAIALATLRSSPSGAISAWADDRIRPAACAARRLPGQLASPARKDASSPECQVITPAGGGHAPRPRLGQLVALISSWWAGSQWPERRLSRWWRRSRGWSGVGRSSRRGC